VIGIVTGITEMTDTGIRVTGMIDMTAPDGLIEAASMGDL
jgi:hypothetical protein